MLCTSFFISLFLSLVRNLLLLVWRIHSSSSDCVLLFPFRWRNCILPARTHTKKKWKEVRCAAAVCRCLFVSSREAAYTRTTGTQITFKQSKLRVRSHSLPLNLLSFSLFSSILFQPIFYIFIFFHALSDSFLLSAEDFNKQKHEKTRKEWKNLKRMNKKNGNESL